jgi:hypothetical protein
MADKDGLISDDGDNAAKSGVAPSSRAARDHVSLKDTVHIFFDQPLPEYNTGPVKAYYAKELTGNQSNCYALVCEKSLMPRLRQADIYSRVAHMCLNNLVERGVVYWPPHKKERYVFVYEGELGKAFCLREESVALGFSPKQVTEIILPPIVTALTDLKNKNFHHGGLRLSNMYPRYNGQKLEGVVIGDALTTPYAYCQPILYNTIPMAMADTSGRGQGSSADDMYALGVCLALLLRTNDPLAGKTDNQVIKEKLLHGSYAAITGRDRFTGAILELLRGLLHDDATQRWTIEDVSNWMEGRRLSPKQNTKLKNAPRPLKFSGGRYSQLAPLAMDLPASPVEVVQLYENEDVFHWIERSLEDRVAVERYRTTMAGLGAKGPLYQEKLVALMSVVLHPVAPIRYKGLRVMPDSLGISMAEAVEKRQDLRPYIEIITLDIAAAWLKAYDGGDMEIVAHASMLDAAKQYLKKTKIGQGLERCIYHLWSSAHCMSPNLDDFFVYDPRQLLSALDRMLKDKPAPRHFIDRHVTAFLMEKEARLIDPYIFDLDSTDDYRVIMAELMCLAGVQARFKGPFVPNLAQAMAERLKPVYERYHDNEKREKIKDKVDKVASRGDLGEMVKLINDTQALKLDQNGFFSAMSEYDALQKEYDDNARFLEDRKKFGENFGREVSAVISSIVAGVIIMMVVMSYFSG